MDRRMNITLQPLNLCFNMSNTLYSVKISIFEISSNCNKSLSRKREGNTEKVLPSSVYLKASLSN